MNYGTNNAYNCVNDVICDVNDIHDSLSKFYN